MMFVEDHWESYEEPALALHVLHDGVQHAVPAAGRARSRICTGSASPPRSSSSIDRLGVRLTVGFNAIPMAVPHTRPTGVTAHATRRDLIAGYEPWLRRVQVPGAAGHLLEFRLGQAGRDALGFAVHVPHYLAQSEYPAAAERLLIAVSKATGLHAADRGAARPRPSSPGPRSTSRSPRPTRPRRWCGRWRSSTTRSSAGRPGTNLLADQTGPLPTADELGAELERFLAEQTRPPGPARPRSWALMIGTCAANSRSRESADCRPLSMANAGSDW